jgi:MFS family permease
MRPILLFLVRHYRRFPANSRLVPQAGFLATIGLVGAFVGALFWGTLSDYIGRRVAFQATVGISAC